MQQPIAHALSLQPGHEPPARPGRSARPLRRLLWFAAAGLGLAALLTRTGQRRFLGAFTTDTMTQLAARFTLTEEPVPETFRTLRPWRTLKLIEADTHVYAAGTYARVTRLDLWAFGLLRGATFLIRPADAYALPLLSLDVVCAGPVRLVALELIAPTPAQAAVSTLDAAHLRPWFDLLAPFRKIQPSDWERDHLLDSSVVVVADWREDQRLLAVLEGYITTYLTSLERARPVPGAEQGQIREGLETYLETLLTRGGPAVDSFKPIVGAGRNRAFVREVMFGLEAREAVDMI